MSRTTGCFTKKDIAKRNYEYPKALIKNILYEHFSKVKIDGYSVSESDFDFEKLSWLYEELEDEEFLDCEFDIYRFNDRFNRAVKIDSKRIKFYLFKKEPFRNSFQKEKDISGELVVAIYLDILTKSKEVINFSDAEVRNSCLVNYSLSPSLFVKDLEAIEITKDYITNTESGKEWELDGYKTAMNLKNYFYELDWDKATIHCKDKIYDLLRKTGKEKYNSGLPYDRWCPADFFIIKDKAIIDKINDKALNFKNKSLSEYNTWINTNTLPISLKRNNKAIVGGSVISKLPLNLPSNKTFPDYEIIGIDRNSIKRFLDEVSLMLSRLKESCLSDKVKLITENDKNPVYYYCQLKCKNDYGENLFSELIEQSESYLHSNTPNTMYNFAIFMERFLSGISTVYEAEASIEKIFNFIRANTEDNPFYYIANNEKVELMKAKEQSDTEITLKNLYIHLNAHARPYFLFSYKGKDYSLFFRMKDTNRLPDGMTEFKTSNPKNTCSLDEFFIN